MKIAYIGQKGIPSQGGGVEKHVQELSLKMAQLGHEVFVYSRKRYTKTDAPTWQGVNIIYTPAIYTKHLEAISHTFFSIINALRHDFDVIHFHSIGPSLLIPFAKFLKPRTKIVATVHSPDYYHQKWNWFARLMLRLGERIAVRFAQEIITVSLTQSNYLWQAYNIHPHYIPNGVTIPPAEKKAELLQQWGLQPQGYILAVSRLIPHKGLHFLIKAYQGLQTDKKLVIVGGSEYTDKYVKELQTLAAGNSNIIFTGKQTGDNLQALFAQAYLFVQPSLSEGLSIALLEALSYGLAVIASDIPENREVIQNHGLIFASGQTTDLAKTLNYALANPQAMKAYQEQTVQHIADHYNWDKIAQTTNEVYA